MSGQDYKLLIMQKKKKQYEIARDLNIDPVYLCLFLNGRKKLDNYIVRKLDEILEVG